MEYDGRGAGKNPMLGRGKPVGLAKPGENSQLKSASTDIPKVARPGGNGPRRKPPAGGVPPKVARPGSAGSIGKGGGVNKARPEW